MENDPVLCPVNSFNEWDELDEVIVGVIDGASIPPWHVCLKATMPREHWGFFATRGGEPFPADLIAAARKELDEFVHILECEGVTVTRPEITDHSAGYSTPDWECEGGVYSAMPRDVMLVVGNEIIEAPMSWRSRFFEINSFRELIKRYFQQGARWSAAPKPRLRDDLYNCEYDADHAKDLETCVLTEADPVFDAADFIRCGRDIFYQRSHVTNQIGAEWLRRHLRPQYRLHELKFRDPHPMHIDATLMPLAPGKLLINPERVTQIPEVFKSWDVLAAPPPSTNEVFYMSSNWVSMNVLMLDEKRVVVERNEELLIDALRLWGFQPIRCRFTNFNRFGGSFHCATVDIRRKGSLQSYF
jgi:glycine amidinotransferase